MALLTYRSSPLANGLSPSELLMGRKLRTRLPILPEKLQPGIAHEALEKAREKEEKQRSSQTRNYNARHRAKTLPKLQPGDDVWIRDQDRMATVMNKETERSFAVKTDKGTIRRNRAALVHVRPPDVPNKSPCSPIKSTPKKLAEPTPAIPATSTQTVTTRSGRAVIAPKKLTY